MAGNVQRVESGWRNPSDDLLQGLGLEIGERKRLELELVGHTVIHGSIGRVFVVMPLTQGQPLDIIQRKQRKIGETSNGYILHRRQMGAVQKSLMEVLRYFLPPKTVELDLLQQRHHRQNG